MLNRISLVKKFFQLDKNYLLENAQQSLEKELLTSLVKRVIQQYDIKINPLGLEDAFTRKIRSYELKHFQPLCNFYERVSAIYRYKFGVNQLEFLWDGSDHVEHYQKLWRSAFTEWTTKFCSEDLFVQAVLDLTVFFPKDESTQMIENRMNTFVLKFFDAKIHKVKGLMVA